ncbi:Ras- protein Rab-11A [Orbilia ellipsospora]|uniref:Ras- protein Rab-11A n=1 Tax=Orbilia ellipsospora TaxID=2528407 RepID=A0AAV9XHC4_9PEZI
MSDSKPVEEVPVENVEGENVDEDPDWVTLFFVAMLGDDGVGKTAIKNSIARHIYEPKNPTTSLQYAIKNGEKNLPPDSTISYLKLDSEKWIRLEVWEQPKDTPIKEYDVLRTSSAMFIYDVTNPKSFESIPALVERVRADATRILPSWNHQLMLVGNKWDLKSQGGEMVCSDKAKAFADENGMLFREVSAVDGTGIKESFKALIESIYENM